MTFADKKGRPFDVKGYEPEDHSHLSEMYDRFSPKAKFQGLPPAQREACEKWVSKLITRGENFIAIREGEVIGHSVLFPDLSKKDGEYMIFVNQGNRGIRPATVFSFFCHPARRSTLPCLPAPGSVSFFAPFFHP